MRLQHVTGVLTKRLSIAEAGTTIATAADESLAKSQLDVDHFELDKFKRGLIEHLAIVRLRVLIAREAEMEQTRAQEVALKEGCRGSLDARRAEGEGEVSLYQGRGGFDAHSVSNIKRSATDPQSGQNHLRPDFAVRSSYSTLT